ncbi:MAG TPA: prolyl oligopeptidase family serine peptidase [Thermoplasmata archaeon]|nr:prolyl oligopeptidase family serine peptidase [Thermoplasmata archaeon]
MVEETALPYERYAQHWSYGDIAWLRPGELLFTANITGQYNLWSQRVRPKGERGFAHPLTGFTDRSVRTIVPAPNGRSIYFMADQDGDEQMQIFRISADGGDRTSITDDRKVRHELAMGGLDPAGRRLLYIDNGRNPADMDVILLDLSRRTSIRPLTEGALWSNPTWDPTGRRFFVAKVHSNTRIQTFVHDLARKTTTEVVPHESEEVVVAGAWTADGRGLLIHTDLDREFKQLELVDLASGKRKVLASPEGDVEDVRYSPSSSGLLYSVNEDGYSVLYSGRLGTRYRRVRSLPPGFMYSSWGSGAVISPDGRAAATLWEMGSRPTEIMWFPLSGGAVVQLSESMVGGVPDGPLRSPSLVRFRTFDGRQIPAFYYLPKRRPKGRMPAVLSIHGGPEAQERPGWNYWGFYAYLNAHGIAVLAPNIRGSSGYGKTYQKLIHHDWGGAELKDLKAAADWMRSRPEIDPTRLGVFGGSFGGFATLGCVARLPEYWKVGVDVVGPSNLVTFVKTVPPFWTRFMDQWVGNPDTEADFLRERSPISYIDNVRADLLVIQGANDPRVNKAESDQMVERLRAKGREVEYMVFEDEGHGFTKRANQLRAMGAAGRFMVDHLRE